MHENLVQAEFQPVETAAEGVVGGGGRLREQKERLAHGKLPAGAQQIDQGEPADPLLHEITAAGRLLQTLHPHQMRVRRVAQRFQCLRQPDAFGLQGQHVGMDTLTATPRESRARSRARKTRPLLPWPTKSPSS